MKRYRGIWLFSFLVVYALFKLWVRVNVIKTKIWTRKLKNEIIVKDSEVQLLRAEYYNLSSPLSIEQAAKEKLSMRYPKKNEIIKLVIR